MSFIKGISRQGENGGEVTPSSLQTNFYETKSYTKVWSNDKKLNSLIISEIYLSISSAYALHGHKIYHCYKY